MAAVKNAAGAAQLSVFFLDRDGKLLAVALPDQELPDGERLIRAWVASLNDAGVIDVSVNQV